MGSISREMPQIEFCREFGQIQVDLRAGYTCELDKHAKPSRSYALAGYKFGVVYEGQGELCIGNDKYSLARGDAFAVAPGVKHCIDRLVDRELGFFFFIMAIDAQPVDLTRRYEDQLLSAFLSNHRITAPKQQHLVETVDFIDRYLKARKREDRWVKQSLYHLCLSCVEALVAPHVVKKEKTETAKTSPILEKALAFIQEHAELNPAIGDIAEACQTSERNLQVLFQRYRSETPIQCLNSRKAEIAAQKLLSGYRVNEVGSSIGIDDPAQFSRFFKKHFGLSPNHYKKQFTVS